MKTPTGVFFNITEDPITVSHVCYKVIRFYKHAKEFLRLVEVVDETYSHPEAPGLSTISRYSLRTVAESAANSSSAATWVLLEASEAAVAQLHMYKTVGDVIHNGEIS